MEALLLSSPLPRNAHFPKNLASYHHFPLKPCPTAWTLQGFGFFFFFKGFSPEGQADTGLPVAMGYHSEPPWGCSGPPGPAMPHALQQLQKVPLHF